MGCGCAERREKLKAYYEAKKSSVAEILSGAKGISIGGKIYKIPMPQEKTKQMANERVVGSSVSTVSVQ